MSAETPRVGDVIKASHYEFIESGIAELSRLRRQHAAALDLCELAERIWEAAGPSRPDIPICPAQSIRAALEETT